MAASTTLMTFMVRAPPHTRCVTLLGSWDNFSKSYPMQRDARLGEEHWTGCHNFSNIICDGKLASTLVARDGGLRMGGTYWYYYRLDDDLEFHNSAEPSTTACPLLPGQLVNVLHVPMNFTSSRSRNASTSSTVSVASEARTMDPLDKYVNPRPAPALPRLKTSPIFPSHPFSSTSTPASGSPWTIKAQTSSRGTSPPTSSASTRLFRLPRKPSSIDKPSRPVSPPRDRLPAGLKAIRNLVIPRSASPDEETVRGRSTEVTPVADISGPLLSRPTTKSQSPRPATRTGAAVLYGGGSLPLRKIDQTVSSREDSYLSMSSFQQRRRQRSASRSREPSPLRASLHLTENLQTFNAANDSIRIKLGGLEAVEEINTPPWPATAKKSVGVTESTMEGSITSISSESQLGVRVMAHFDDTNDETCYEQSGEKRLPTLPNTPSSAYPVSEIEDWPMRGLSLSTAPIGQSHFSVTTIDTNGSHTDSSALSKSHFSAWTTNSAQSPRITSGSSFAHVGSDLTDFERSPDLSYSSDGNLDSPQLKLCPTLEIHDSHVEVQIGSVPKSNSLESSVSYTSFGTSPDEPSRLAQRFQGLGLDFAEGDRYQIVDGGSVLPTPLKTQQTYQLPLIPQSKFAMFVNPDLKEFLSTHQRSSSRDWRLQRAQMVRGQDPNVELPHNDSMRELMEEIGYLRGLIGRDDGD